MRQADLTALVMGRRYQQLPGDFYHFVAPQPLQSPCLVAASVAAARLLDLEPQQLTPEMLLKSFSGEACLAGSQPLATVYAGHQFGGYSPVLGDGRALLLGEVRNQQGECWEVQLKGSGRTPYSRHGDGRASLRSVIREYLASEALAALQIPTTRALCIIGSETPICRQSIESAALLVRLSPSHIRFGHFEYFHYARQPQQVKRLADFVIEHHYSDLAERADPYLALFRAVVKRTAHLVALWQAAGFCHGVMNTDNMSIIGVTLDFGPFAFIDQYQPGVVSNLSDERGRYAFNQQPSIGLWNCVCLAQAFSDLVAKAALEEALGEYEKTFAISYTQRMKAKLGLTTPDARDAGLVEELLRLMQLAQADYTQVFAGLNSVETAAGRAAFLALFGEQVAAEAWLSALLERRTSEPEPAALMRTVNPYRVLRNYWLQQAIERAQQGDYDALAQLQGVVQDPWQSSTSDLYSDTLPSWGVNLSTSCAS